MADQPQGVWSKAEVAGQVVEVYEPPRLNDMGYTVIYLHGVHLGKLHEQTAFLQQADQHGLRIVVPITQRSWWADRICPEFHPEITAERYVRQHVMEFLADRYAVRTPRVALLGTSMGGQGALRLSFKYPDQFPLVAAIAPAIDYQNVYYEYDTLPQMYSEPEAARQDTALLHVHPLNWPRNLWFACDPADLRWYESSERLKMKLYSLGIMHDCDLETSNGGHSWTYYNHMAPAAFSFLMERLERERLRLPVTRPADAE